MKYTQALDIAPGKAICYSGFREGQNPGGVFPTYKEIKEDLLILQHQWKYLRLYDCDKHAETVLEVIQKGLEISRNDAVNKLEQLKDTANLLVAREKRLSSITVLIKNQIDDAKNDLKTV